MVPSWEEVENQIPPSYRDCSHKLSGICEKRKKWAASFLSETDQPLGD